MIQSPQSNKTYDTVVVGGGIMGLWAMRHAVKRGERALLLEKREIGTGASGGFLGALMPHMPDNWNEKKQLQYDGLSTLNTVITDLEEETGVSCGFRRCGRLIPLTHDKLLSQVDRRLSGARENWAADYTMRHIGTDEDNVTLVPWLDATMAKSGIQHDTFSARINPRSYLRALEAYVRRFAEVREGCPVIKVSSSATGGTVSLSSGELVSAGKVVVANGWEAYPLLQPFMGDLNAGKPIGRGVKGQAVLLEFQHDDDLPIVYHDGAYVVPHEGNRVAIGSTSLNNWTGDPNTFDPLDMEFYDKALDLVPALRNAPIVGRWAGVRPRNTLDGRGTSPWFGPVPGHENLIALIGGFKITLGIAHLI